MFKSPRPRPRGQLHCPRPKPVWEVGICMSTRLYVLLAIPSLTHACFNGVLQPLPSGLLMSLVG